MASVISTLIPLPFAASQAALKFFLTASQATLDALAPTGPARPRRKLHGESKHPFDLEQKKRWDAQRFGHLDHTRLGDLATCVAEKEMRWPDYTATFVSKKGYTLLYKAADVEREAERIADIYRRAVDEINGNSLYEWHHRPDEIRARVRSGDFSIWGTYERGALIGVNSAEFIRGQRAGHWIWGAVDPPHRGKGVWENIGVYMDKVIELSGAQYGMVWMVTTHVLSQRMAEKAGWKPVGVFPGGEFMGGSDGKYYRHSSVWYVKLYGDGLQHLQAREDLLLTPMAERVARVVLDGADWTRG